MRKIMDIVLGIGIAIIVYLFFVMALKVFIPQPQYGNCSPMYVNPAEPFAPDLGSGIYTGERGNDEINKTSLKNNEDSEAVSHSLENVSLDEGAGTGSNSSRSIKHDKYRTKEEARECFYKNDALRKKRNFKIFIAAVVIGMLLILCSMFILAYMNIAAGITASGIALILYGFAMGWNSSSDAVKLVLLFIASVLVIGIALWLGRSDNRRGQKNRQNKG